MIILGTNSIKETGYDVANSCRFDSASSADLRISDYSGAGTSRRIRTYSMWIKRSKLAYSVIFGSAGKDHWVFTADHKIQINIGSGTDSRRITDMVFRDVSAFYHIVFAYDTTQGTASNRFTMWVNGAVATTSIVGGKNEVAQNEDALVFINGDTHTIGSDESDYFDGYMAEWVFVDGQKLDADSFGEYDSDSGIWKPKNVSGINLGTNGFYLNFQTASDLGIDAGNDNDFEPTNLTALDQSTDTCTNNFATLNPVVRSNNITFAEGNLKITGDGSANFSGSHGTIAVNNGKWYCEVKVTNAENLQIGALIINSSSSGDATGTGSGGMYYYYENIYWQDNNTAIKVANSPESGANASVTGGSNSVNTYSTDIISMALDMDNGRIYFAKNGTYENSGNPANGTNAFVLPTNYNDGNGMTFYASLHSAAVEMNFGSPSFSISSGNADGNGYGNFEYAVPSGYFSLNTKNLAEYG